MPQLPPRPSLEQLQKQAKELVRELRATDQSATLAAAQFTLARDYGFATWADLKHHIEQSRLNLLHRYEQIADNLFEAHADNDAGAIHRLNEILGTSMSPDQLRATVGQRLQLDSAFTRNDAYQFVARLYHFENWDALVESIAKPPSKRTGRLGISATPPFYRIDSERNMIELRPPVHDEDWDFVIDLMNAEDITGLHAGGQMTGAALEQLSRLNNLTRLNLSGCRRIKDGDLQQLRNLPHLRHLELTGCSITDEGPGALKHLTELREFFLCHHRRVSDEGLRNLATCRNLERVDLMGTTCGDGAAKALTGKENLRHFKSGTQMTDAGLALLREFPVFKTWQGSQPHYALMEFEAEPNYLLVRGSFTETGTRALASLDGLFALNLDPQVEPSALKPLHRLPNLGWLGYTASDESMPYISALPRLRMLMCQDTQASDEGFRSLSQSRTLEYIWGRRCYNLTGRGFEALSRMPSLRGLSVSCRNVDDAALATLPHFPALTEFMPMDMPDSRFRHIGRCTSLESLWCMYCRETGDAATEHIASLQLKRYYAGQTRITDRSLELLARMESLESITLWACAGVTDAGIAALAQLARLRKIQLESLAQVTRNSAELFPPHVEVAYAQ